MHFSFWQKFGASLLISAWLVWGSIMIAGAMIPHHETPRENLLAAVEPTDSMAAEKEAPAVDFTVLLADASAKSGAKVFNKCKACHSADEGGKNKVGPNLWDIVGHDKAAKDGFAYSEALQGLGGDWSYDDLNHFLTDPKGFAPGTKMTFAGLDKPADRAAVIAFLRSMSDNPPPLP